MNADRHEYSEEVYYAAIEFFQGQNMEDNVIQLQKKIIESTFLCDESNCMLTSLKSSTLCNLDCALIYGDFDTATTSLFGQDRNVSIIQTN